MLNLIENAPLCVFGHRLGADMCHGLAQPAMQRIRGRHVVGVRIEVVHG